MKKQSPRFDKQFLEQARHALEWHHLPRIVRCLQRLSAKEVWWRPHRTSNSVGNLVLHLEGNVRQWLISGLGGQPDRRRRDQQFAECGPIPRPALIRRLRRAVREASGILKALSSRDLARVYSIQGFRVNGLQTVSHVMEHFAHHAGQIIYATKLQRREDLGFTRLPGEKAGRRNLPAI